MIQDSKYHAVNSYLNDYTTSPQLKYSIRIVAVSRYNYSEV